MKRILISLLALTMVFAAMIPALAENTETDSSSALADAQSAYKTAKQSTDLTEYEAELKAMVEAGSLTQEQADLLLTAAKEGTSLANGVCPNCGYQFQYTTAGKNGHGKGYGRMGRSSSAATVSDDATALEQAQAAYAAAKQSSRLTDYEAELKAMVEAGSLTQEQADELLAAAKEADSLANGVCPNCGYQFQTTVSSGRSGMKGGKNGGRKH